MESKNEIKTEETPQKKLIFESLTEGWDKDYDQNEIPPYLKEIRLAVIGNVDSGKSTLVGCLTKGIKDDGRGYARKFVFNYEHENKSGRTSSIAEDIIGFRNNKMIYSTRLNDKKNVSWKDIASQSDHVITLLDLCGHEKYLKTTMYGVSALLPHYAVILIGTNMGVQRMTKEHLGIVVSLNIPFFIVFTKVDIAPKEVKEKTINTFTSLLKTGLQKSVFTVKSEKDAEFAAKNVPMGNLVPIFQVSTVTGEGLDDFKFFLSQLIPKNSINAELSLLKTAKDKTEVLLDNAFNTKVGCIHAGVVVAGKLEVNQKLLLGPTKDGFFKPVQVREIEFLRVRVDEICCGNSCSFKLKSLDKNFELNTASFKKGMVLLDPEIKLEPTMEFEVEALIVHHSSTIKVGYQSVVHCHVVRQTCTIVAMDKEFLRSGDKGIIKFRFLKKPEYLHLGDTILFREGRTRGKGKIIKIFPIDLKEIEKEKNINQNKKSKKAEIHNKNKINNNANTNNANNTNNINNNANTNNINIGNQSKKEKKKYFKNKNKEKQNDGNNNNKNSDDKNPQQKKKEG